MARLVTRISTAALIFLLPLWSAEAQDSHKAHSHDRHMHESAPALEPAPDSLYQSSAAFTTQEGRKLTLEELQGQPVVIAMFYGSCKTVCPVIIERMKQISGALDESRRTRTRFVLASFDPKVDSPEALKRFHHDTKLPEGWLLLSGSEEDTQELAVLLGVSYKQNPDKSYTHTSLITLLDRQGRIVSRVEGLASDLSPLTHRLKGEDG